MSVETSDSVLPAQRRPKKSKRPIASAIIAPLAVGSGIGLTLAVPGLVDGDWLVVGAKSILLGTIAAVVSYGVNRFSIERGAALAAIGYPSAAITSVAAILLAGTCMSTGIYAGFVSDKVAELKIEAHASNLLTFVDQHGKAAAEAMRVTPVINAVVIDIAAKRACEIANGCLSGSAGNRGPVGANLAVTLSRAESISQQVTAGATVASDVLARATQQLGMFQTDLQSNAGSVRDKTPRLRQIDARIRQLVSELDEAAPRALVEAYAAELSSGVDIPARPEATKQLSTILRGHAAALRSALPSDAATRAPAPAFPKPAGVSDTLTYIGDFLPIAAVTGLVELVLPLVLWIFAFLIRRWEFDSTNPHPPSEPHEEDQAVRELLLRPVEPKHATQEKRKLLPAPIPLRSGYLGQVKRNTKRA